MSPDPSSGTPQPMLPTNSLVMAANRELASPDFRDSVRQMHAEVGLHLCRQLAELVDGCMSLDETPGGGCTFALTIPGTTSSALEASDAGTTDNLTALPFGNVRARPAELARSLPDSALPDPAR